MPEDAGWYQMFHCPHSAVRQQQQQNHHRDNPILIIRWLGPVFAGSATLHAHMELRVNISIHRRIALGRSLICEEKSDMHEHASTVHLLADFSTQPLYPATVLSLCVCVCGRVRSSRLCFSSCFGINHRDQFLYLEFPVGRRHPDKSMLEITKGEK